MTMLFGGPSVALDLNRIVVKHELGRLLWSQFVFTTSTQALFAVIILFTCRWFERQLGIKKYGAFFAITLLLTFVINVLLSITLNAMNVNFVVAPGPYFFIFAQLALFHSTISPVCPVLIVVSY
jgi:hypothetical protein